MANTKLQSKNIVFCSACSKPIAGDYFTIKNKLHGKEKWSYHTTVDECANAPAIKKDWRRIDKQRRTETYNGAEARLHEVNGYSWQSDDGVSMRFGDMEP